MFDIHCHILFDVDDGSRSFSESKAMVTAAKRAGIDRIVCTPHCRGIWWHPDRIATNFPVLQEYADGYGITMDLGYEVNWKKLAELGIDTATSKTIGDTNLFLLEFSDDSLPPQWELLIRRLKNMGLQPIIAHPERYAPVQRDIGIAEEMKRQGCYLQLSANFIEDNLFGDRKRCATQMLKMGLVDYVASDAHRPADYQVYQKALAFAQKY